MLVMGGHQQKLSSVCARMLEIFNFLVHDSKQPLEVTLRRDIGSNS